MFKKKHIITYIIYTLSLLLLLTTYKTYHNQNKNYIDSYNYYIMIKALKENDEKTAKKYAKDLINISSNNTYNGISYLLLSKLAKNKHRYKKSKLFLKNYNHYNLILKNLITPHNKRNI